MSNISYFGRSYKLKVWQDLLEGYGFFEIDRVVKCDPVCIICAELGTVDCRNKVYSDVNPDYFYGTNKYINSLHEQRQSTFCKYYLYMLYAEGVTDNP